MRSVPGQRLLSALRILGEPRPSMAAGTDRLQEPRPVRLAGPWLTVDSPTLQVRVIDTRLHLPTASVDYDVLARVAAFADPQALVFRADLADSLIVEGPRASWRVPYVTGPTPARTEVDGPQLRLDGPRAVDALTVARSAVADMSEFQALEHIHIEVTDTTAVVTGSDRVQLARITIPATDTTPGPLMLPAELVDVLLRLDSPQQVTLWAGAVHHGRGPCPAVHATVQLPRGRIVEATASTTDRAYPDVEQLVDQREPGSDGTWSVGADAYLLRRAVAALGVSVSPSEQVRFLPDGRLTDTCGTAHADLIAGVVPIAALDVRLGHGRLTRLASCLSSQVVITGAGPSDPVHFRDALGVHALLAPIRRTGLAKGPNVMPKSDEPQS